MSDSPIWPTLKRVLIQGWQYKWLVAALLSATALVGGLSGVLIKLVENLLNQLQSIPRANDGSVGESSLLRICFELWPSGLPSVAVDSPSVSTLQRLDATTGNLEQTAWLLLAGALPMAAIAYTAWLTGQYLANRCTRDLRERFVGHLVRLDLAFHSDQSRGELLSRMTADLDRLYNLQALLFGRIMQRPAIALGCAGYVFWLKWQLGVAVFLVLAPMAGVIHHVLQTTRRRSQRAQESLATTLTAFEQITAGIKVIKAMGSTEREVGRYAGLNDALFTDRQKVARARARSEAVTQGAIWLIGGVTFLVGAWLFTRHLIQPSELITVLMAFGLMINALRETQRGWADVVENLPSAERVYQILDTVPSLSDRPGAPPAPAPTRAIRFEQVRFRYAAESGDVLGGVDLEFPVGRTTALVGKSGGGKSTILDLLPRLRDVTAGRITWDGVDVREVQADSLIRHCAIVSQEAFLFNDSIRNNIRYGKPDATVAEIEQAARRAHIHDDILNLEGGQGYDTPVGDRGGKLSGGQRQRIAIARALLRDAPILLLDEPTSALDAESERHVQAALDELMKGRTTVVIAHRLATVQHAHRIHVIGKRSENGPSELFESGTHAELVAKGGVYAELVRLQQLK